jgi:hypothetical protein
MLLVLMLKFVARCDIFHATVTLSCPNFTIPKENEVPLPSDLEFIPATITPQFGSKKEQMKLVQLYPKAVDLSKALYDANYICAFLDRFGRNNLSSSEQFTYSNMVYKLDCRIYSILMGCAAMPFTQDPLDWFYKACCNAASVYLCLAIRKIPTHAPMYNSKVAIVHSLLVPVDLTTMSSKFPALILWMLFVTGSAAVGRPERIYFVAQVANISLTLKLQCWEDVERLLNTFLWVPKDSEIPYWLLWTEAEALRINEGESILCVGSISA